MIYDLNNEFDRKRFSARANELYKKRIKVELTEPKPKRSSLQNRYLHLILTWFAIETGNTLEWVKVEFFKKLVNPEYFILEVEDKYIGKAIKLKSSSELNTAEMTVCVDRFRNWASQNGVYIPAPNEHEMLSNIELEARKYKEYL